MQIRVWPRSQRWKIVRNIYCTASGGTAVVEPTAENCVGKCYCDNESLAGAVHSGKYSTFNREELSIAMNIVKQRRLTMRGEIGKIPPCEVKIAVK